VSHYIAQTGLEHKIFLPQVLALQVYATTFSSLSFCFKKEKRTEIPSEKWYIKESRHSSQFGAKLRTERSSVLRLAVALGYSRWCSLLWACTVPAATKEAMLDRHLVLPQGIESEDKDKVMPESNQRLFDYTMLWNWLEILTRSLTSCSGK
jgi:hypothetical protein